VIDLAGIFAMSDRRRWLCRHAPKCPECGDPQVQLVDWFPIPAEWKCRKCKHKWTFEPPDPGTSDASR
jgi:ribosomal protein L37AE/L43A